ncbi:hypothetical protein [Photorhabdus laumondii]|uniref:hypothetical protein n=1 Tax=Photorhabdus laumondii TaxID=2218628 RepID=UPI0033160005
MMHHVRRYWSLRKWRNYWRADRFIRKQIRHSRLSALFNFEGSYRLIKLFVMADKERGKI